MRLPRVHEVFKSEVFLGFCAGIGTVAPVQSARGCKEVPGLQVGICPPTGASRGAGLLHNIAQYRKWVKRLFSYTGLPGVYRVAKCNAMFR